MSEVTTAPDVSALEVPMDTWTKPFWDAADRETLLLPQCGECERFRWPPGPFCPFCHSQVVAWQPAGQPQIYSYTIIRQMEDEEVVRVVAPALVEFPDAGGVRLLAAIVDTRVDQLQVGSDLILSWSQAANVAVPVFRVSPSGSCEAHKEMRSGGHSK